MKILLLEDNVRFAKLVKNALEQEGWRVDLFLDGEDALNVLNNGYSCFVLDINVPSQNGITILETIRLYNQNSPVIIMSSNHDFDKIQTSYQLGCSDYLKKPFYIYELICKIKKLACIPTEMVMLWKGYNYNYVNHRLFDSNQNEINLAKKEILFLELFVKNPERVVSFEELEQYVWEGENTSVINIRALFKRLRKKLPEGAIESLVKIGYKLGKIG